MMRKLSLWHFWWLLVTASLRFATGDAHAAETCSSEPCPMSMEASESLSLLQTRAAAGSRTRVNTKLIMASDEFQGFRWVPISFTAACEGNHENIQAQAVEAGLTLAECKDKCLHFGYCLAVDYFEHSRGCKLYDAVCSTPGTHEDGASSYRLEIFVGRSDEGMSTSSHSPLSLGQLNTPAVVVAAGPVLNFSVAEPPFSGDETNRTWTTLIQASAVQANLSDDPPNRTWSVISADRACEENDEGIKYLSHDSGFTLESCKESCRQTRACVAIDFYFSSGWCLLYDQACKNPKLMKDGGVSYSYPLPPEEDKEMGNAANASEAAEDIAQSAEAAQSTLFPTPSSSADDVAKFMNSIQASWAAQMMKADDIDGEAFQMLRIGDLREYGMKKGPALKLSEQILDMNAEVEAARRKNSGVLQERPPPVRSNALHDVVGPDGVLMISLDRRPERFQFSSAMLRHVGINAVKLSAIDRTIANSTELARGCPLEGDEGVRQHCAASGKTGYGCKLNSEQAIAASHLRALEEAQKRTEEWTAIFEDDVVPAPAEGWSDLFRKAWERVPAHIRVVRLGYCQLDMNHQPVPIYQYVHANISGVVLSQYTGWGEQQPFYYEPGGCTSAYLVHKSILPEMIKLFPCCGSVDSCYKWDFFKTLNSETKLERGMEIMMNMDSPDAPLLEEDGNVHHYGLIRQDRQSLFTSRLKSML
mmetsp:Transcript_139124/g.245825  ORF Transcript_139124/g.245825 Transcript_139124/m.245825 type:complete len:703 (-) Transcript_139124:68-2176(-)